MRSPWRSTHPLVALGVSALAWAGPIAAQTRGAVEAERREFAAWLRDAPLSPRRAVVVRPVGPGLSLGPSDTDIPLEGVSRGRITERAGRVMLEWRADTTSLARGRSLALGDWHLVASGPPGRASVTAFGRASRTGKSAIWFRYDPAQVYNVVLTPPQAATTLRVLGADGVEVEATEAGTVVLQVSGSSQRLRVLRMPGSSDDESELEVYFRDPTNSGETYPSGRFVSLIPKPGGGYLIDLNRARSPFCAYNTVFPCPAPWKGKRLCGAGGCWGTVSGGTVIAWWLTLGAMAIQQSPVVGTWRAALDLAGGILPFEIRITRSADGHLASLCNGPLCDS